MDNSANQADFSVQSLVAQIESYKQAIYSLKRNEAALKIVQQDLSSELDSVHKVHTHEIKTLKLKCENLIEQHSDKLSYVTSNYDLQLNSQSEEIAALKNQLSQTSTKIESSEEQSSTELIDLESRHQEQILELKNSFELQLNEAFMQLRDSESEKSQLTEQYQNMKSDLECAVQNFNSKKEEVEQLKEQVQELQEEQASMQMQMNTNNSTEHEEKGNSLFAEVNDRRLKLEYIVRQNRSAFLEMRRQHAESTKENRLIGAKILVIENRIADVMQKIGSEDEQLQKSYENQLDDQRIRIRELEKKITRLERDQLNTSPKTEDFVYNLLDISRKDLQKAKTQIDELCLEKKKLNVMIKNSEKEAQRWQAECAAQLLEIVKIQSELTEFKVQKGYESFVNPNELSSESEKEILSKAKRRSLEKVSEKSDGKYSLQSIKKEKISPLKQSGSNPLKRLSNLKFVSNIQDSSSGEVVDKNFDKNLSSLNKELLTKQIIKMEDGDKENVQSTNPHQGKTAENVPELILTEEIKPDVFIEKSKQDVVIETDLYTPSIDKEFKFEKDTHKESNTLEIRKRNPSITSILKSKYASPLQLKNENEVTQVKGVTFSSNTVSPQTTITKLKKNVGVAVPVTFIKSNRAKAIRVKDEI